MTPMDIDRACTLIEAYVLTSVDMSWAGTQPRNEQIEAARDFCAARDALYNFINDIEKAEKTQ